MNFLSILLLVEGEKRIRIRAEVRAGPRMKTQKRTNKVKKKPMLFKRISEGVLASLSLL